MGSYPPQNPENGSHLTKIIHNDTYPFISSARKSSHRGRAVVITGGNRGIGKAIALSFARAGATFIGVGALEDFHNLKEEIEYAAKHTGRGSVPEILLMKLDVTDSTSVAQAALQVEQTFGRLDVLINNAGYMMSVTPVTESDETEWWRTFEVNLKGVYLMAKSFIPLLLNTSDGLKTIVNLNSVAAHNLRPNASAYGTSKWAVLKFTEFMLVEFAGQGLLAYSVHPGGIMTRLAKAMPKDTHAGLTDKAEMTGDTIAFLTQVPRLWLAGRYISCTWDMEEFLQREDEIVAGDMLKLRMQL